jgi:TonB family protein
MTKKVKRLITTTIGLIGLISVFQVAAQESDEQELELQSPPKLTQLVPAEIPEGTVFPGPLVEVVLEIEVAADGTVSTVRVVQGVGEPFDDAAREAAEKFVFEPGLLTNGQPVPVTVTFKMKIPKPIVVKEPPPPKQQPKPVKYAATLLERGTRKALSAVEVLAIFEQQILARGVTDSQGRVFLLVAKTKFRLVAVPAGHEKLDVPVVAEEGEEREESFYVESTRSAFETVVRASPIRREVTKQVIPKEVVTKVAGTQGDTLKVVKNLPGVARSPYLSGTLILRGSAPGDSRVFLEGQEIPILYHFGALRSTFNSAFLNAVEFIPGNFSPDYGRAMGGIIDVRVQDPVDDMFRGEVDINLYDAGFVLQGPLGENWSLGGAFHRSWVDTFIDAVIPEDANLSFSTAPRYYDYQFIATWEPDREQKLRLMWYGSMDSLALLFERPVSDPLIRGGIQARIMFHNLQASYKLRISESLSQESSIQLGMQEIDTQIGPELFFDLNILRFSIRHNLSYKPSFWLTLRAGLDLRLDGLTIDLNAPLRPLEGESSTPVSTRSIFFYEDQVTLYEPALFVELEYKPWEKLVILPSARLDYYKNIQQFTLDPRLVVRYQPLTGTVIKGGVGYYQQPPTPDQAVAGLGNPNLSAVRSSHSSLGVEQVIFDGIEVELTGFYKWLDRQVIRNQLFFTNPSQPSYVNGGTGRILGLELLVKARIERFNGWLAYSFQRSYRKDGAGLEERLFDFDQPHILTVVANYDFGKGWSLGLRFQLVSGSPTTPVVGAVYDVKSDNWVPLFGQTNSQRLPLFHQLDVRLDKTWTFDRWKLSLYLDVVNAYFQKNVESIGYNYDYTIRNDQTGIPILPILGVKGEW